MKTKALICFVSLIMLSGCASMEPNESQRVFIDLEYLDVIKNIDLSEAEFSHYIQEDKEFTWWEYNYTDQGNESISNYFEFIPPKEVNISKKAFIVSYGRKLTYLYYDHPIDLADESWWGKSCYIAHPVFEREYHGNVAFIYLVDKVNIADSLFGDAGDSITEIVENGNIPFELPLENLDDIKKYDTEFDEVELKLLERTFIGLEYLDCVENADLSLWYDWYDFLKEGAEFTWWTQPSYPERLLTNYDFTNVDTTDKKVIISYGRKLKYLYYESWDEVLEGYYARPVFEREYNDKVAHIYLIDKMLFVDDEYYEDDLFELNVKGNIPFELPAEN